MIFQRTFYEVLEEYWYSMKYIVPSHFKLFTLIPKNKVLQGFLTHTMYPEHTVFSTVWLDVSASVIWQPEEAGIIGNTSIIFCFLFS